MNPEGMSLMLREVLTLQSRTISFFGIKRLVRALRKVRRNLGQQKTQRSIFPVAVTKPHTFGLGSAQWAETCL